jgi:hypothetical protein
MLISIAGNGYTFAEDLVRRNFVIELDPKLENPELRKFAGNFFADIAQQRPQLLQAALTIWRYGRQQVKSNHPPLGGYEQWSAWVRDPLVALGCQDPVSLAEIAKLKTSDPTRLETVEILQAWWEHHRDNWIKANDLDEAVKELLVPDSKKRSRQNVASLVAKLVGTRLAGFHLTSDKDDKSRGRWTPVSYRLEQVGEDESEPAAGAAPAAEARPEEADDPDDWQFHHEPDDAAARPAAPAPASAPKPAPAPTPKAKVGPANPAPKSKPAAETTHVWSAGKSDDLPYTGPVVDVPDQGPDPLDEHGGPQLSAGVPAFITTPVREALKRREFTDEEIYDMGAGYAHEILADPNRTAVTERYQSRVVGDAPANTPCLICGGTDGVKLIKDVGAEPKPLHLSKECADKWFANDDLPDDILDEPEPAREPEPEQQPQPLPPDPVERWRIGFARLDPARDPCAGFRTGEWPRMHNVIRTFLAGPFAKRAVDHGWTERELFGVHPVVGVARSDCCGVLMANALGAPVTRVTSMLFQFGNVVGHKATLNVGSSVPVWDWKGAAP